jgi:hypothetical protein
MLIWVLHLPQDDGSVLVKPFIHPEDISTYLMAQGASSIGSTGPISPKVGDYRQYHFDDKTGYAILGQVRYN